MTSFAQSLSAGGSSRARARSRTVPRRAGDSAQAPLPLSAIPIAAARRTEGDFDGSLSLNAWAFVVLAVAAHALLAWLAINHRPAKLTAAVPNELSFELERPKPPPKIEPPKPPPPKPQRPVQVLPNIQEAVPDPNPQTAVASDEPVVAAAPAASAPPAPPPVTRRLGEPVT